MPKLTCPCGFVHNLSPIPDDGWITIRDRDFEAVIEAELEARKEPLSEDRVTDYWGLLYECPRCGRVMWRKPGEEWFTIFRQEQ